MRRRFSRIAAFLLFSLAILLPDSTFAFQQVKLSEEKVDSLIYAAYDYRNAGSFGTANDLLSQAIEISGELEYRTGLYHSYSELGRISRYQQQFHESVEWYYNVLNLILEDGSDREFAATYNNLAGSYLLKPDFENALKYLNKSLHHRYKYDDPLGTAMTYRIKAALYADLRDYNRSIMLYRKAIALADGRHDGLSYTLNVSLAGILNDRGDHNSALILYYKALDFALETENLRYISTAENNISQTYRSLGKHDLELEYSTSAYERLRGTDFPEQLILGINIARMLAGKGELEQARRTLEETESFTEQTTLLRWRARWLETIGILHREEGRFEKAASYFSEAFALLESLYGENVPPGIFWEKAFNLRHIDIYKGIKAGEKALTATENWRNRIALTGSARTGFFAPYAEKYAELAKWHLLTGNANRVFDIIELSRARAIADDIFQNMQLAGNEAGGLRFEFEQKRQQLRAVEEKLEAVNLDEIDESSIRELQSEYVRMLLSVEEKQNEWIKASGVSGELLYPQIYTAAEVRDQLGDNEALMAYAFTRNKGIAVIVRKNQIAGFVLDADRTEFSEKITEIRDLITAIEPEDKIRPKLAELSGALLDRFAFSLDEIETLHIMADGPLNYLPFEALVYDEGYFVNHFTTSYLPSFSLGEIIRYRNTNYDGDILVLANPVFGSGETDWRENLRQLPFTYYEAEKIADIYPENTRIISGHDANKSTFLTQNLENYSILHLATHGIIDEYNLWRNGLVFGSEDEDSAPELLRISEVYDLDLNADIVVLSACNSGIGELVDGEGLMGLHRAFQYAGARTTVMSLWSIHDQGSAVFMDHFYRAYNNRTDNRRSKAKYNHQNVIKALREARLEMLQSGRFSHPAYWAPFTAAGW